MNHSSTTLATVLTILVITQPSNGRAQPVAQLPLVDVDAEATRVTLDLWPPPPNDLFASRSRLPGSNVVVKTSNVGATHEAGEPNHAGIVGGKSVWWQWNSSRSGRVFVSTYGSSFDTLLAVYAGPVLRPQLNSLTTMAANDDLPYRSIHPVSFVAFDYVPRIVLQPQQLYIAVDGKAGANGRINLAVTFVPRPDNDQFSARTTLAGTYLTVAGSVIAATREAGEPPLPGPNGARTVWYSWTAPANPGFNGGSVTLRVSGADFVPEIGVFRGDVLPNLAAVPISSHASALTRETTFAALPGATYQIAVAGNPDVDIVGHSFVERATLGPAGTFVEGGSFSLSLELSTLALDVVNLQQTLEFEASPRVLNFSAMANISNHGSATSRALRVRFVAVPGSPDFTDRTLGIFTPPSPGAISAGDHVQIPVSGQSPVGVGAGLSFGLRWSVYALLEEQLESDWLPVASTLVTVVLPVGVIPTGGGVIIPDPPLRGADNCRWNLVAVEVIAPKFVVEGSTNSVSYRVVRQDSCSAAVVSTTLTKAPWESSLAGASFSTNGVLAIPMGTITTNTSFELSFEYEYQGIASVTRTNVLIYNREPRMTSLRRLANGHFVVSLETVPVKSYFIETSTNLHQWTTLTLVTTDSDGRYSFTNATVSVSSPQFFRARER